jgi:hypothetical protein
MEGAFQHSAPTLPFLSGEFWFSYKMRAIRNEINNVSSEASDS